MTDTILFFAAIFMALTINQFSSRTDEATAAGIFPPIAPAAVNQEVAK